MLQAVAECAGAAHHVLVRARAASLPAALPRLAGEGGRDRRPGVGIECAAAGGPGESTSSLAPSRVVAGADTGSSGCPLLERRRGVVAVAGDVRLLAVGLVPGPRACRRR